MSPVRWSHDNRWAAATPPGNLEQQQPQRHHQQRQQHQQQPLYQETFQEDSTSPKVRKHFGRTDLGSPAVAGSAPGAWASPTRDPPVLGLGTNSEEVDMVHEDDGDANAKAMFVGSVAGMVFTTREGVTGYLKIRGCDPHVLPGSAWWCQGGRRHGNYALVLKKDMRRRPFGRRAEGYVYPLHY